MTRTEAVTSPASVLTPAALALIDRVIAARSAFRAADLSRRGADVLIALGYWDPGALTGVYWEDRAGVPGLGGQVATAWGCGPATLREIKIFHHWNW